INMDENSLRILREKEEEIQQLQLNLRRCESKNAMLEEVAQEFEDDFKRAQAELVEYKEHIGLRSEGSMRDLRVEITRLEGELADAHSARDSVQINVNRLEKLLEEERQSRPVDESFHPDISTCTSHEEEIKLLREEIEEGVKWRNEMIGKMEMRDRELEESNERADEAMKDGNDLRRALEDAKQQITKFECDLNDMKHNSHFASKGNSMFSEFVDERKKLEKELKQLYEENLSLRLENRTLLSEIEEESMRKGRGIEQPTRLPCKCSDLQAELYQTRNERDIALQASRSSMISSTDELKKAGLLEASQRKRMTELRDEAKRHYIENDRLRRAMETLKMEQMNANVDKNTWKEKFQAQTREVERLKELLTALRKKHSALSRPSHVGVTHEQIAKMCTKKTNDVPSTPAPSARAFSCSSSLSTSSTVRHSLYAPVTPATGLKRTHTHQDMNTERKLEELNAMESSARAAELSINSSIRRKPPTKRPKTTFLSNVVKAEVQTVVKVDRSKTKEDVTSTGESSLEKRLRDVTPPDETEEVANGSNESMRIGAEEKKGEDELRRGGRENHDPSFVMSKERMPADSNLEATVLDESMMIT
ncbi:hypothetical protein PMAYCL1PPCAC_23425, partial [Pristionchus mayeri]